MEVEEGETQEWTLDSLPLEVLLHIIKFIPAHDLINSLSLVSQHFHKVLNNEKTWKIRAQKKWGGVFPPIPLDEKLSPPTFHRISTYKREQTAALWASPQTLSFHPHIGCVDAVHLFKGGTMLATGARDRAISLIHLDHCIDKGDTDTFVLKSNAHDGWIWDFVGIGGRDWLGSAGWDGQVKFWDLERMDLVAGFTTTGNSPALCLSYEDNLVVCGSFDSKTTVYDVRTDKIVSSYKHHKRSVLSLGLENGKVVSAGEDNRIVLLDLKAGKVVGKLQLPQPTIPPKTYPKSISYGKTGGYPLAQFYIGDIRGSLYLVDLKTFKIRHIYPSIHTKAIQGVFHTLGAVFTCSADGQLIIHEPSRELRALHRVQIEKTELPKVHCLNNRVALAGGDSVVRVYYG